MEAVSRPLIAQAFFRLLDEERINQPVIKG
jgi:hypothetical protein